MKIHLRSKFVGYPISAMGGAPHKMQAKRVKILSIPHKVKKTLGGYCVNEPKQNSLSDYRQAVRTLKQDPMH
jgi:hypothetical protein